MFFQNKKKDEEILVLKNRIKELESAQENENILID